METIRIPVRAVFERAPRGKSEGWTPKMTGAVYADVPVPVVRGAIGACALAGARCAKDEEAAWRIEKALEDAELDGVIERMK